MLMFRAALIVIFRFIISATGFTSALDKEFFNRIHEFVLTIQIIVLFWKARFTGVKANENEEQLAKQAVWLNSSNIELFQLLNKFLQSI